MSDPPLSDIDFKNKMVWVWYPQPIFVIDWYQIISSFQTLIIESLMIDGPKSVSR